MESLETFESSMGIKRVQIDNVCNMNEKVELSFAKDKLSFKDAIPITKEEAEKKMAEKENRVNPNEMVKKVKEKGNTKVPKKEVLEIDEATKAKVLEWCRGIYNQYSDKQIQRAAETIFNHCNRLDITYKKLEEKINALYNTINR